MKKTNVTCPNCKTEFELDQLLVSNFENAIKKDLESELQKREEELNQKKNEFNRMSKKFAKEKEDVDELVNFRVKTLLQSKEEAMKASIQKEVSEEKALQLQELENELIRKSNQLIELNQTKAKLEKLKREMEEAETRIIL